MKTASAKNKGRVLQKLVVDKILKLCPELTPDDVKSTSMGVSGPDIQLSTKAKVDFPAAIECKNRERLQLIYDFYNQALRHADGTSLTPLVVLKSNRQIPLCILSLDDFFNILEQLKLTQKENLNVNN